MKQGELLAITEGVAEFVRGHVGSAMEWTAKRLKELEDRIATIPAGKDGAKGDTGAVGERGPVGEQGPRGEKGADGAQGERGERGAAGNAGAKGEPGAQGTTGTAGTAGARGEKGEAGRDGKDADPEIIKQYVSAALLEPVSTLQAALSERLDAAVKALPVPKDGKDGEDGERGERGADGAKGDTGKDGRDGKDFGIEQVRGVLEGEVAKWALDFERRAGDLMQRAIDRMPKPKDGVDGRHGSDGKDGFEFIELDFDYDGERGFTVKASNGKCEKSKTFKMPIPLYRGTYKTTDVYEKADSVTYAGSVWIAQQDNPGTPGDGPTWKLSVRKGVDGKGSK